MSESNGCNWPHLSEAQLKSMTIRTFTIHPPSDADEQIMPTLELRCDPISFSQSCEAIGTQDIRVIGQLSNSSNGALLGEIEYEEKKISVVIKPSMYENPLWDFPWGTLAKREVASFEMSQLLGWNIVPPTILRDVNDMESSVQLFIPHNPREHYFTLSAGNREAMEKFAVFDYIVNNADRKGGHILNEIEDSFDFYVEVVGDDDDDATRLHASKRRLSGDRAPSHTPTLWGIDHGLTFHVEDKLRTVIWEFSEEPISEELVRDVNVALPKMAERLKPFLESHEIEATMVRVEKLLLNPFHRALDANERAFPWPLV